MALIVEPAHISHPGNGFNYAVLNYTPSVDAALRWRWRGIRPPNPPINSFARPMGVPFYLTFSTTVLYAQMYMADLSVRNTSIAYTTLEAAGFPLVGELVDLEGEWDPVSDKLILKWRDPSKYSFEAHGGWNTAVSNVFLGMAANSAYNLLFLGGASGSDAMVGDGQRWRVIENGTVVVDVNPEVDIDTPFTGSGTVVDTFQASVGGTVTVNRWPNIDRLQFLGASGEYVSTPDAAAIDFTGDHACTVKIRPGDLAAAATTLGLKGLSYNAGQMAYGLRLVDERLQATFIGSDGAMKSPTTTAGDLDWSREYFGYALDADDGTGRYSVRFYDSADGITWTLKRTVNGGAGITAVIPNTADALTIGGRSAGTDTFLGAIEEFKLYNVIDAALGIPPNRWPVFAIDRHTVRQTPTGALTATTGQAVTVFGDVAVMDPTPDLIQYVPTAIVNEIPVTQLRRPSIWSLDLCWKWKRVATAVSYRFQALSKRLDGGEFRLTTTPAGVSGGERTDPFTTTTLVEDTFPDDGTPAGWTDLTGTWDVVAGELQATAMGGATADAIIVNDTEMPSPDQFIEADITGFVNDAGICVRMLDASNYYMGRHNNSNGWEIYKRVAGVWTLLTSTPASAPAAPFRMRLEAEGTELRLYYSGGLVAVATDPDLTEIGQVGFRCPWVATEYDNVVAGSIEAGEVVPFDPRSVDTFRLVVDGQIAFSGVLRADTDEFKIIQDEDGERWEWVGSEAGWTYLDGRLAYPNPNTEQPWAVAHDTRTGVASSVLAAFIEANMGALAIDSRSWGDRLAIEAHSVGEEYTFSARLQTLKEIAMRIGRDAGVEVIPEVDFNGTLRILITSGRDLSDALVLSDQGDLSESSITITPMKANYILSAGQGELTARTFRTSSKGLAGWERVEKLSDQSNMASASELQADADSKLVLNETSYAIVSELTDEQASLALGLGIRHGDKLSVVIRNRRYRVPIESFAFDISPERQVLRPIFGTAIPGRLAAVLKALERAGRRIGNDDMVA